MGSEGWVVAIRMGGERQRMGGTECGMQVPVGVVIASIFVLRSTYVRFI